MIAHIYTHSYCQRINVPFITKHVCVRVPNCYCFWRSAVVKMASVCSSSGERDNIRSGGGEGRKERLKYVVVGGGIAAISVIEQLLQLIPKSEESPFDVCMVSPDTMIKRLVEKRTFTENLKEYEVQFESIEEFSRKNKLRAIAGRVASISHKDGTLAMCNGETVRFDKLCICSGASPKTIFSSQYCLSVRDRASVERLSRAVSSDGNRVVVVGNGGIALEVIHACLHKDIQILWVLKDAYIGNTFFDASASDFFLNSMFGGGKFDPADYGLCNWTPLSPSVANSIPWVAVEGFDSEVRVRPSEADDSDKWGFALGPNWLKSLQSSKHCDQTSLDISRAQRWKENFKIEYETTVVASAAASSDEDCNVFLQLSNGKSYGCDYVVSATGVWPEVNFTKASGIRLCAEDGGIVVNERMETNLERIYAAGDCCSPEWTKAADYDALERPWFQMRLWDQAEAMGRLAALSMCDFKEEIERPLCFDLFTHVTSCFGYKVVLLGLYNGQFLGDGYEQVLREKKMYSLPTDGSANVQEEPRTNRAQVMIRNTPQTEYIKCVLMDGRVCGAMLIGDTDLEETFENLMLSRVNVSGMDLLNPDVDLEDFFD